MIITNQYDSFSPFATPPPLFETPKGRKSTEKVGKKERDPDQRRIVMVYYHPGVGPDEDVMCPPC